MCELCLYAVSRGRNVPKMAKHVVYCMYTNHNPQIEISKKVINLNFNTTNNAV